MVNDKLYILGGEHGDSITTDVYSLDLTTLSSSSLILKKEAFTLPTAVLYFGAVAIHNSIYIIGGADTNNISTNKVYRIDL